MHPTVRWSWKMPTKDKEDRCPKGTNKCGRNSDSHKSHRNIRDLLQNAAHRCTWSLYWPSIRRKRFSLLHLQLKKIIPLIEEKIDVKYRHYFIDGSFKVIPFECFTQLLVIHIGKFDTVHPFIFVLMSNRTQQAYTHVFKYIHEHIYSLNCASFCWLWECYSECSSNVFHRNSLLVSFCASYSKENVKLKAHMKLLRITRCNSIAYCVFCINSSICHCISCYSHQLYVSITAECKTMSRTFNNPLLVRVLHEICACMDYIV